MGESKRRAGAATREYFDHMASTPDHGFADYRELSPTAQLYVVMITGALMIRVAHGEEPEFMMFPGAPVEGSDKTMPRVSLVEVEDIRAALPPGHVLLDLSLNVGPEPVVSAIVAGTSPMRVFESYCRIVDVGIEELSSSVPEAAGEYAALREKNIRATREFVRSYYREVV